MLMLHGVCIDENFSTSKAFSHISFAPKCLIYENTFGSLHYALHERRMRFSVKDSVKLLLQVNFKECQFNILLSYHP